MTGQVIRAVGDWIVWMQGSADGPETSNGAKRWDATTLGARLATDVFKAPTPGLSY